MTDTAPTNPDKPLPKPAAPPAGDPNKPTDVKPMISTVSAALAQVVALRALLEGEAQKLASLEQSLMDGRGSQEGVQRT